MKVTVVGCSGSYPGPESAGSCYLVEADREGRTWRILLDLGNGALGTLHRFADPLSIDAVLLTHLHPDHCLDLCGYYVLRKYHPSGPWPALPVYGPPGTAARLARAYDLPEDPGMTEEFDFRTVPHGRFEIGPFAIEAAPVEHPVPAYAFRVTVDGAVFVYSGDTGPCAALDRLADGADLYLAEASFVEGGDNPPALHLTGRDAGLSARSAGVRRLVLTHIPPWYDPTVALGEASAVFDGEVELARVGASYEL